MSERMCHQNLATFSFVLTLYSKRCNRTSSTNHLLTFKTIFVQHIKKQRTVLKQSGFLKIIIIMLTHSLTWILWKIEVYLVIH